MPLVGAFAAVLLLASACSSSGESDSAAGGSSGGADAGMAADSAAQGETTRSASAAPKKAAEASLDISTDALVGQDIIRTGSLTVLTDDLTATRAEVAGIVVRLGGVVASETTVLARGARHRYDGGIDGADDGGDQSMQLSLQVPTARFDSAMTAIAEVVRVQARSISTQDVTAQVADVDSRVESARAALERVRALLTRANSLGTVISLEGVLSDRQADLEALLAQQRALQGQTQLATITLDLRVAADGPAATQEADGFVAGLRTGWDAFTGVLVGSATVLGMLVPFVVLVAPLAAAALVWRRRRSGQPGQLSPPAT